MPPRIPISSHSREQRTVAFLHELACSSMFHLFSPQVSIVERHRLRNSAKLARGNLWNWQSKKLLLDLKFGAWRDLQIRRPRERTLANIRFMQIGNPHGKRVRGQISHTNYRKITDFYYMLCMDIIALKFNIYMYTNKMYITFIKIDHLFIYDISTDE